MLWVLFFDDLVTFESGRNLDGSCPYLSVLVFLFEWCGEHYLLFVFDSLSTVHLALFFERAEVSLEFFEKTHRLPLLV